VHRLQHVSTATAFSLVVVLLLLRMRTAGKTTSSRATSLRKSTGLTAKRYRSCAQQHRFRARARFVPDLTKHAFCLSFVFALLSDRTLTQNDREVTQPNSVKKVNYNKKCYIKCWKYAPHTAMHAFTLFLTSDATRWRVSAVTFEMHISVFRTSSWHRRTRKWTLNSFWQVENEMPGGVRQWTLVALVKNTSFHFDHFKTTEELARASYNITWPSSALVQSHYVFINPNEMYWTAAINNNVNAVVWLFDHPVYSRFPSQPKCVRSQLPGRWAAIVGRYVTWPAPCNTDFQPYLYAVKQQKTGFLQCPIWNSGTIRLSREYICFISAVVRAARVAPYKSVLRTERCVLLTKSETGSYYTLPEPVQNNGMLQLNGWHSCFLLQKYQVRF
jgi:hypothetical protein